MIKAVLFDLDGVLVDMVVIHQQSFNSALHQVCGFELSQEEHVSYFNGLPTKKKLEKLISQGRVTPEQKELIFNHKQQATMVAIRENLMTDWVKKDLHVWLKVQGLKLVCVTNSIRQTTELMLQTTGQLEYLDFIISNEDVIHPKPNPEGYLKAMKMLNLSPQECVIVEDSPHGLHSAQASGGRVLQVSGPEEVTIKLFKNYIKEQ